MTRPHRTHRIEGRPRPTLSRVPAGWTTDEAREWLDELDSAWSALARYGESQLDEAGFRRLGVGVVQRETPVFECLARNLCIVWATLDARDGWGQTVGEVAKRQRYWFTRRARPIIKALCASIFDVYEVESRRAGGIVLRRVRDREPLTLHARLDDGAYPVGATVVARVVSDAEANASIASAVVDRGRLNEAMHAAAPETFEDWSDAALGVALEQFTRVASESRGDVLDPIWLHAGAAPAARLHRAFDAFTSLFDRRPTPIFEFTVDRDRLCGMHLNDSLEIEVRLGATRYALTVASAVEAATADCAVLGQGGWNVTDSGIVIAVDVDDRTRSITADEANRIARLCARAALELGERKARRAA